MNLRQAAQRALKAMEDGEYRADMIEFSDALIALRAALAEPEQNPFGDDAERYARKLHEEREYYKAVFTERKPQTTHWEGCEAVHPECRKPEQKPVAWITPTGALYRTEDVDGCFDYTHIPLYAAPTPRKPLTDEMVKRMKEVCTSMEMRGAFADGWLSAEAAHGIGEQT